MRMIDDVFFLQVFILNANESIYILGYCELQ